MQTQSNHARLTRPLALTVAVSVCSAAAWAVAAGGIPNLLVGSDSNSVSNPFIQPVDPAFSGGGRDQTLQFGDILSATDAPSLQIGRLGTDILMGGTEDDVLVGGTEHFNPSNRDRAFGGAGEDVFLWSPGDGSDFFQGGPGIDAVVFGLMGEIQNNQLVFQVTNDQQAGDVFIDPSTGLPIVDVTNSPGFCQVIDDSSSPTSAAELDALGLDHLVQFVIRSIADDFANGVQDTDNGLRVTLHLDDVEILVCTDRNGGVIETFNLTVSPPQLIPFAAAVDRIPSLGQIVQ